MKRLALLGCWNPYHASDYVSEVAVADDALLVAVWDDEPARGKAFAAEHGLPFAADLHALLLGEELDGAIVPAAPDGTPGYAIIAAARAGVPILADHIYATSAAEAEAIGAEVRRAGVPFAMDLPLLDWPINLAAVATARAGRLGRIVSVRIRNAHGGAIHGVLPERFGRAPAGIEADLGAHGLYLMRALLGMPQAVVAAGGLLSGWQVPDQAASLFEFAGGAFAVLEASNVSAGSPFAIEVYGTEGCWLGRADSGRHRRLLRRSDAVLAGYDRQGRVLASDFLWESAPEIVPGVVSRWLRTLASGKGGTANDETAGDAGLAGLMEGADMAALLEAVRQSFADGGRIALSY